MPNGLLTQELMKIEADDDVNENLLTDNQHTENSPTKNRTAPQLRA